MLNKPFGLNSMKIERDSKGKFIKGHFTRNMAGKNSPSWKGGRPKCLVCGKQLVNRYSTHCKLHNSNRGKNHHSWKGGITSENEKIRKSFEYRLWRKAVFDRDNYMCIWCGAKSGNGKAIILQADHIKPFSLFPELRFAIDNGRTLCISCHKKTGTWGGKSHE